MTPSRTPTASRTRWTISLLAIAGTLPYLVLKTSWLSGSRAGLLDPDFGHGPVMYAANALTLALDAVAVLMALAFVTRWGSRLPARLVLLPMWVGTGLLAPILLVLPLQLLLGTPSSGDGGAAAGPIADWVYLVVYAGFAWQGLFLLLGFVLHARARWGADLGWDSPLLGRAAGVVPVRVVAALVLLAASATGLVATALRAPAVSPANLGGELAVVLVAAAGLAALASGRPRGLRRRVPLALVWTGSAGLAAWGLYSGVLLVVPNDLVGDRSVDPVAVLTQGLRLAAGLVTVAAARPLLAPRQSSRASERETATSFQVSTLRNM